jgi:hypothetical protein
MRNDRAAVACGDHAGGTGRAGSVRARWLSARILEGELFRAVGVAADLEDNVSSFRTGDVEVEIALAADPRERAR